MTSDPWQDLGYAIRKARLDLGWSLSQLAGEALGNEARKGYVSQVEKGQRNLSPETIDKFDQALDLPDAVVRAAHMAPPPGRQTADPGHPNGAEAEEKLDRDAERLIRRATADETAPQLGETLLIALAYEFAGGRYIDLHTAYVSLRLALEAARRIGERGELRGDNTESQLSAVLAEVAKLNDAGDLDGGDALLEAEERRMREAHAADAERMAQEAQALLDRRLDQDRLRNDPAAAADRIIAHLRRAAPPGGRFQAARDALQEWQERGERNGDQFDLRVALVLANRNLDLAKGPRKAFALGDLGNCRLALGRRSAGTDLLEGAHRAYVAALKAFPKRRSPENWAVTQHNLGTVLRVMGERRGDRELLQSAVVAEEKVLTLRTRQTAPELWASSKLSVGVAQRALGEIDSDPGKLQAAIAAFEAALSVWTPEANAEDWAKVQTSIGIARRTLGRVTGYREHFEHAETAYNKALHVSTPDLLPYHWANAIGGLGELALERYAANPDPKLIDEAERLLIDARTIMATADDFLNDRIDDLLARIAAARGA